MVVGIGALIAGILGAGGQYYSSSQIPKVGRGPRISPLRLAGRSRLQLLASLFPEEMGKYEISYDEFKRLKAENQASVIRIGKWPKKDDDGSDRFRKAYAASGITPSTSLFAASRIGKGKRSTGTPGGPRFYRLPTSDDLSRLASKAFSQQIGESERNAARLASSDLYKSIFEQSEGRLGAFGAQLDRTTEDLAGRALGVAATRGSLGNPAVANRALAPIALNREAARFSAIEAARAKIRSLSTTDGLRGDLGASTGQLAGIHQFNLNSLATTLGPSLQAAQWRSSLLSDGFGQLGGAFGRYYGDSTGQTQQQPQQQTQSGTVWA